MTPQDFGLLNPWLRNIRDVYHLHQTELNAIEDEKKRYDRLVELNVLEQCINVTKMACVQERYLWKNILLYTVGCSILGQVKLLIWK